MPTVTIEVPDDAFAALYSSPQELGREMKLAAAMVWYTQGRISHERAAEFAGVSRTELIDALAAARLPAFSVDADELMEEVEVARKALSAARESPDRFVSDHVTGWLGSRPRDPGPRPARRGLAGETPATPTQNLVK